MAKLTPKMRAFIEAYMGEARFNAVEACRIAGYAHPEASSRDLMNKSHRVREEIESRLEELLPSDNELLMELVSIAKAKHGDEWIKASDKRQAIKDLMELRGKLIHKHEVTGASEIAAILGVSFGAPDE